MRQRISIYWPTQNSLKSLNSLGEPNPVELCRMSLGLQKHGWKLMGVTLSCAWFIKDNRRIFRIYFL